MYTYRIDPLFKFTIIYCEYGLRVIYGEKSPEKFINHEIDGDRDFGVQLEKQ